MVSGRPPAPASPRLASRSVRSRLRRSRREGLRRCGTACPRRPSRRRQERSRDASARQRPQPRPVSARLLRRSSRSRAPARRGRAPSLPSLRSVFSTSSGSIDVGKARRGPMTAPLGPRKIRRGPLSTRNPAPPRPPRPWRFPADLGRDVDRGAGGRFQALLLRGQVGAGREDPIPGGIRFCSHSRVSLLVSMVWIGVNRALSASTSMPVRATSTPTGRSTRRSRRRRRGRRRPAART